MDATGFEAQLRADGFQEIEKQNLVPRPGKGEHGHPFAIRGLVLEGTFIVMRGGQSESFGPGQIFSVAEGVPHDESIGPDGATVIVGRRHVTTG